MYRRKTEKKNKKMMNMKGEYSLLDLQTSRKAQTNKQVFSNELSQGPKSQQNALYNNSHSKQCHN